MSIFGDEPIHQAKTHEIGQDLSLLSISDLQERILALQAEIARLQTEIESKSETKSAAEALFRRS